MNPKIRTFGILLISVALFYLVSCEKKQSLPVVGETRISNITKISAVATGYILTDGGGTIDSRGFCRDTVSAGTAFGDQLSFETYHDSLVDIDNNIYYSILYGNQEWMGSNLKVLPGVHK